MAISPKMKPFDVVLGSGAEHLKERFQKLGFRVFSSDLNYDNKRKFPNSDVYLRIKEIEKLANRRIVVVQGCTGSSSSEAEFFTSSDRLVELLLCINLLRNPTTVDTVGVKQYKTSPISAPSQIDVVLTFQPFAAQDKAFLTGEVISSQWALEAIASVCDRLFLVSPVINPKVNWAAKLAERGFYEEIEIAQRLIEFGVARFGFADYIVVAPDEGSSERFDVPGFCKVRTDSFTIELKGKLDVKGKNVVLIDDFTKSGTTLLETAERLKSQGAADVGIVVLHVMPIEQGGEEMLENLFAKCKGRIVTSNSVFSHATCYTNSEMTFNIVDTIVEHLE